jgi:hypothetical protein
MVWLAPFIFLRFDSNQKELYHLQRKNQQLLIERIQTNAQEAII